MLCVTCGADRQVCALVSRVPQLLIYVLVLSWRLAPPRLGRVESLPALKEIGLLQHLRRGVFLGLRPRNSPSAGSFREVERIQMWIEAIKCCEDGFVEIIQSLIIAYRNRASHTLAPLQVHLEQVLSLRFSHAHQLFPLTSG